MSEANSETIPQHVAIIMDGNGRWAQRRGLPRSEGHKAGVDNVKRIVEAAHEQNIRYLTLYAFSVENWKRPSKEVNGLMQLLDGFLGNQAEEMVRKEIRLRVIGQLDRLAGKIRRKIQRIIDATAKFEHWNLTLALNYGSRTELLDAVKAYADAVASGEESNRKLDWDMFSSFLYTADLPDPDLVIRTSGEHRVSNFLLLQSAYAEYYFAEQCWPDFDPQAFSTALKAYACRQRRFGLTGEQIISPSS